MDWFEKDLTVLFGVIRTRIHQKVKENPDSCFRTDHSGESAFRAARR